MSTSAAIQFLKGSKDTQASQLALRALKRMDEGATVSGAYLAKAWEANVAAGKDQTDAMKMRRAALAQDAYDHRVSSEKGRMMAAYALMASREGDKAITAQQAAAKANSASEKKILVETAKFATLRRNVMLQAMETAEKNFKAPALPPLLRASAKGNEQVTLNMKDQWRPPSWVGRTNLFFPEDVRVAAGASGALSGLGNLDPNNWWDSYLQYQTQGVLSGFAEAARAVEPIVSQEPGSASVAAEIPALMQDLQLQQTKSVNSAARTWLPWWLLPVALATGYYFWK